jgi:hypothetical protein
MTKPKIVAVGLLTEHELRLLGAGFSRAWPVDHTPCFEGLLSAIDEAELELSRARDQERAQRNGQSATMTLTLC